MSRNFHKILWQKVMSRIHEDLDYKEFEQPPTVERESVCSETGLLPRAGCPTITEYFDITSMPTERCDEHYYTFIPRTDSSDDSSDSNSSSDNNSTATPTATPEDDSSGEDTDSSGEDGNNGGDTGDSGGDTDTGEDTGGSGGDTDYGDDTGDSGGVYEGQG